MVGCRKARGCPSRRQPDERIKFSQASGKVTQKLEDFSPKAEGAPEGAWGRLTTAHWPPNKRYREQHEIAGHPVIHKGHVVYDVEADHPMQLPRDEIRAKLPEVIIGV